MQYVPAMAASRAAVAAMMREWYTSLAAATASEQAELYACAVALVREALTGRDSLASLLEVYYLPEHALVELVTLFCADGEIPLYPHIVIGAACALHLRQIVASANS